MMEEETAFDLDRENPGSTLHFHPWVQTLLLLLMDSLVSARRVGKVIEGYRMDKVETLFAKVAQLTERAQEREKQVTNE